VLLRRIVNASTTPELCTQVCEQFRHFRHPNLVPLHSIGQTTEFVLGFTDVIAEYRYVKGSKTLQEQFFANTDGPSPAATAVCTEALLWSIACQLLGLIRTFHEVGVPLRGLHLTKVLYLEVTGRVLFSGVGLLDLVAPTKEPVDKLMRQDISNLGYLLLRLASQNWNAVTIDAINPTEARLSPVLVGFIRGCLEGKHTADVMCRGLGERMAMELGQQLGHADFLMGECAKEVHNGRLLKLLVKLNFVHAATSDHTSDAELFALRLFHAYVFHQADESGRPRHDWGHVFFCLNKLDVGSEDLVQLISMDNDSTLLVISYRDLRTLLDKALDALVPKPDLSQVVAGALQNTPGGLAGGGASPGM
jgi:PAB-dependent poly(A)-specific ribonuclease subunit 3